MKWISKTDVKTTLNLVAITGLLCACAPEQSPDSNEFNTKIAANVIYGSDGRLDLYQVTDDRLKALADSTVALMRTSDLSLSGSTVTIKGKNFGTELNLCPSERYREQDTAAFCSGTLVAPDVILTAGHCIETQSSCDNTAFVFGFAVQSAGVQPQTASAGEVYRCREIIKTVRVNTGADFAIIRLDRTVLNHTPLQVRPTGDAGLNDSLVVIGHPVGLPTKIATGGRVRTISNSDFFQANLDTYGGNSGSAVFNASTGLIEGVLVRGEEDFESRGNCTVSKVCADGACRGEDVTKISVIRAHLPSSQTPAEPSPPALQDEVFTSSLVLSIPDNNRIGVSSSLNVTGLPNGRKVTISVKISHTYIGDLSVKVMAPDGKVAVLHERAGGNTRDLNKSFEVTSQLGRISTAGIYKLSIQDLAAIDKGSLLSWSVRFH
ncbi:MAG: hypothetical protein A2622_07760 [Bdellovibrionales bacterium RIFCSPHIGHO2_01_FULL_40_29]|nr:MAG: hypothetical protein A2622_07760 [Bdellovibrionales bacterium RIFCSPHIGHO2_01_FULL_40_29]OFZ34186.1 MAG: hypothetical protein A3D17_03890 [Bdellovibrionales bacterium RIFCSPHIGHO2_02_FULL_40_15]